MHEFDASEVGAALVPGRCAAWSTPMGRWQPHPLVAVGVKPIAGGRCASAWLGTLSEGLASGQRNQRRPPRLVESSGPRAL
jgi:hypothetical protein